MSSILVTLPGTNNNQQLQLIKDLNPQEGLVVGGIIQDLLGNQK